MLYKHCKMQRQDTLHVQWVGVVHARIQMCHCYLLDAHYFFFFSPPLRSFHCPRRAVPPTVGITGVECHWLPTWNTKINFLTFITATAKTFLIMSPTWQTWEFHPKRKHYHHTAFDWHNICFILGLSILGRNFSLHMQFVAHSKL